MDVNFHQCLCAYPIIIMYFQALMQIKEIYYWYFPNVMLPIISFQHLISSTFVSDVYGLIQGILYLIFSHHTAM